MERKMHSVYMCAVGVLTVGLQCALTGTLLSLQGRDDDP